MKLIFAPLWLFLSIAASAAPATSGAIEPTAAAAPQSMAEAPSAEVEAGQLSLGLGVGINSFGGNMGRLYSGATPAVSVLASWTVSRFFAGRLGGELAGYSFNAAPYGAVNVRTKALLAGIECHYLGSARDAAGFDPYMAVGGGSLWRTQTFQSQNSVDRDSALLVNGGLGTNYRFAGSKLGLWLEANATQAFFRDRYSDQYAPSGISDTTGLLWGGRAGVKYVF